MQLGEPVETEAAAKGGRFEGEVGVRHLHGILAREYVVWNYPGRLCDARKVNVRLLLLGVLWVRPHEIFQHLSDAVSNYRLVSLSSDV